MMVKFEGFSDTSGNLKLSVNLAPPDVSKLQNPLKYVQKQSGIRLWCRGRKAFMRVSGRKTKLALKQRSFYKIAWRLLQSSPGWFSIGRSVFTSFI
jgi:hypothetical protein